MREIRMNVLSLLIAKEFNQLDLKRRNHLRFFKTELYRKILKDSKRQEKRKKGSKSLQKGE